MSAAKEIVERYLEAFYAGDAAKARALMADEVSVTGPAARFRDADSFLRASAHVSRGVKALEMGVLIGEGADVCAFYELVVDNAVGRIPMAEWYHLKGDKIASIRIVLDMAPFKTRGAATETAIDPVCRMTVDKSSPAATRDHDGVTYYFCAPGCASAFERAPERYLAAE